MIAFIIGNGTSIGCASLFVYLIWNYFGYWGYLIGILIYLFINSLMHLLFNWYCKSYISKPNAKHLIIISTGHLGHYLLGKQFQSSFKDYFEPNEFDEESNSIMVYLAKNNHNGFFCYSLYKTNDGIENGHKGMNILFSCLLI
eukprot:315495_1